MPTELTKEELLAKAKKPAEDAMRLHPFYRGKVQIAPKCVIRGFDDFAIWYTPGVAAPCRAIQENEELAYEYTNKGNTVAVVSDGTRVLGLGDIGPLAGLPVMEGKALLFKYLGGVDAVPICLDTKDPYRIILAVKWLQPSFGGINLEDISQPKCFRVLDMLRTDPEVRIPVWHDDQQGTATVILAGVINALKVVGKRIEEAKFAIIGVGAANVATIRLLLASGVPFGNIVACDSKGILHPEREDIAQRKIEFVDKWRICQHSNAEGRRGGPAEAMRDADVCIAASRPGPGTILPEWIKGMAEDAIIFACANPSPKSGPGRRKRLGGVSWAPAAATSLTRSTTRWASPASSAACWTYEQQPSQTRWLSLPPGHWPAARRSEDSMTNTSYRRWMTGRSSPAKRRQSA